MSEKPVPILKIVAFPLLIAALVAVAVVFWKPLVAFFGSPERIGSWVKGAGIVAPLAFMLIQIIQVVVFVIPGEVAQIAGGYLFGPFLGTVYSIIGITVGSVVNFVLGRKLGVPFVTGLFGAEKTEKFETLTSSPKAQVGFFLLFVVPGIPKDILCYVAGISRMRLPAFLAVSMIGRLPGIIGSSWIGSSAEKGNWTVTIVIAVVAIVLFALGSLFQERIRKLAEHLTKRDEKPRDGA
jgi:uncharacterized membrane protein YdjX (TVP38/TMEM64 family)